MKEETRIQIAIATVVISLVIVAGLLHKHKPSVFKTREQIKVEIDNLPRNKVSGLDYFKYCMQDNNKNPFIESSTIYVIDEKSTNGVVYIKFKTRVTHRDINWATCKKSIYSNYTQVPCTKKDKL